MVVGLVQMCSIEDPDVGSATGTRSGDQVRRAIAIDITRGQANPSVEVRIVGIETGQELQASPGDPRAVKDLYMRAASGIGTNGDVVLAIAIEVGRCDKAA